MDTGSLKSPAPAGPLAFQRVDAAPRDAVRTELPPAVSVQQAGEPDAVRFERDPARDARAAIETALQDVIERNTTIDPKTREVVFQTVDRETGEVVRQVPDDAILKLRAYAREMRDADLGRESGSQVHKIA